jgi:hypothetical protein
MALGSTQPPVQCVRGCFLGVKRPGVEADHSPAPNAEVKTEWSYTSASPIYLHGVDRNNCNFTFHLLVRPTLSGADKTVFSDHKNSPNFMFAS